MNRFNRNSVEPPDVLELLCRVSIWFESEQAIWEWYDCEQLLAFGGLTPRQIVDRYHEKGIKALNEWVTERETAGFQ